MIRRNQLELSDDLIQAIQVAQVGVEPAEIDERSGGPWGEVDGRQPRRLGADF